MTAAHRVRAAVLVLVALLLALTGCVQVPTAGPVEKVPGQAEACQNCVNVEVAPPRPGAEPREVVEGYLRAMFSYQPGYTTAKQFLTAPAAAAWRPELGVTVYSGAPQVDGNNVHLKGTEVGAVEDDRTYIARDTPLDWDFRLVQENGQWRIGRPPEGLLVADHIFRRFYTGYSTFFVSAGASLVPERIYLPVLRNPANTASALMTALLDGPSDWLAPAVTSDIPMGTELSVESVPITNGIAEVPLNDTILTLAEQQRSMMAAQIVSTLRQVTGVKGVLITVNKQKIKVLGADPTSLVIGVDTLSKGIDPVLPVSGQLFAVRDGRVHEVLTADETPTLQPVNSPLGRKRYPVDSLAVSVNGTDVAAVTDQRTALRRSPTGADDVTPLASGLSDLLRPQFSRYGEVWTIGRRGGEQRIWRFAPSVPESRVVSSVFDRGEVTAFRISPDGVRMALVRRRGTAYELGLARIVRQQEVRVEGWKPINVTQTGSQQLARIVDVAWLDANELLVLGASAVDSGPVVARVAADASRITAEGDDPEGWNARELSVLSRPQTFVVVGEGNRTWRKNGGQWVPLLEDVTTLAYGG